MSGLEHPYLSITLPWPPRECSPNYRGHWATVAKAKKIYRHECWGTTKFSLKINEKDSCGFEGASRETPCRVIVEFYPYRKQDTDNMIASFKSGQDGVADALGIDDANLDTRYRVFKSKIIGRGYIILKIWRPSWMLWPESIKTVIVKKIGVLK